MHLSQVGGDRGRRRSREPEVVLDPRTLDIMTQTESRLSYPNGVPQMVLFKYLLFSAIFVLLHLAGNT